MTIRLTQFVIPKKAHDSYLSSKAGAIIAHTESLAEAETARLAFERVLLPRFTADEAIALCLKQAAPEEDHIDSWLPVEREFYLAGMRAALEGLAAAGVFVPDTCGECTECNGRGHVGWHPERGEEACDGCKGTVRVPQTMADKLDAAGIK